MIDLDELIAAAQEMEPLPESATRLAGLFAQEEWELPEISDVVRHDLALGGRLLRMANSASFGGRAEITDVKGAVMRVGAGAVLALALGAAATSQMNQSLPIYGLSEGELWRHSVSAALAIERAQPFCSQRIPAEAHAAALLHDMGKLLLARFLTPQIMQRMQDAATQNGRSALAAEMAVIETNHGEVGGLIGRHWGLPAVIIEGIQYHHQPEQATSLASRTVCDFVALADAVCASIDQGCRSEGPLVGSTPELWARVGITAEGFQSLGALVQEGLGDVLGRYQ
jgi:HD-like signal output (HDOD) protein